MKVLGGYLYAPLPPCGEGLGERGDLCSTVAITASRPEQTSGFGHVLPQGFYEFVFNHCPSPQPLPRKGGGAITDANASPSNSRLGEAMPHEVLRPTLSFAPAHDIPASNMPGNRSLRAVQGERRLGSLDQRAACDQATAVLEPCK